MFSSQVFKNIMSLTSLTLLGWLYLFQWSADTNWRKYLDVLSNQARISEESTHVTKWTFFLLFILTKSDYLLWIDISGTWNHSWNPFLMK